MSGKKFITECITELERRKHEKTESKRETGRAARRKQVRMTEEIETEMKHNGKIVGIELLTRITKERKRERTERIEGSRYNKYYKEIRSKETPGYLGKGMKAEDRKTMARFRCGSGARDGQPQNSRRKASGKDLKCKMERGYSEIMKGGLRRIRDEVNKIKEALEDKRQRKKVRSVVTMPSKSEKAEEAVGNVDRGDKEWKEELERRETRKRNIVIREWTPPQGGPDIDIERATAKSHRGQGADRRDKEAGRNRKLLDQGRDSGRKEERDDPEEKVDNKGGI